MKLLILYHIPEKNTNAAGKNGAQNWILLEAGSI